MKKMDETKKGRTAYKWKGKTYGKRREKTTRKSRWKNEKQIMSEKGRVTKWKETNRQIDKQKKEDNGLGKNKSWSNK